MKRLDIHPTRKFTRPEIYLARKFTRPKIYLVRNLPDHKFTWSIALSRLIIRGHDRIRPRLAFVDEAEQSSEALPLLLGVGQQLDEEVLARRPDGLPVQRVAVLSDDARTLVQSVTDCDAIGVIGTATTTAERTP